MPLVIKLDAQEEITINGVTLRNSKQSRADLRVITPARIVREAERISPERASRTPAGGLHALIVRCLEVFDPEDAPVDAVHDALVAQISVLPPAQQGVLMEVGHMVADGRFNDALRALKPVLEDQERCGVRVGKAS